MSPLFSLPPPLFSLPSTLFTFPALLHSVPSPHAYLSTPFFFFLSSPPLFLFSLLPSPSHYFSPFSPPLPLLSPPHFPSYLM